MVAAIVSDRALSRVCEISSLRYDLKHRCSEAEA